MFETTRQERLLEFPAQACREQDPKVREYFPQACHLKFVVVDAEGEIHCCVRDGGSL